MRCKVVGTYLDYEHTRDGHRYFVELLVPEGYRRSRDILSVSMFDFIRAAGLETGKARFDLPNGFIVGQWHRVIIQVGASDVAGQD